MFEHPVSCVQVETCKDSISAALETLKPTTSWTAVGQGLEGVLISARGFGVAMASLIDYLSSQYGSTFALGVFSIYLYNLVSLSLVHIIIQF